MWHSPGRPSTVALVLIPLVVAAALPAAGAPVDTPTPPDADNTATRIQMYANGSARWSIEVRTRLDTDERVSEFRAFRGRLHNDSSSALARFRDRMRGVVAGAADATGREMVAANFSLSTRIQEVPRRWGIVTYEFTWTGFAARDGDGALVVGDVFEGGLFLAENDRLVVTAPDGFGLETAAPPPDDRGNGTAVWIGREDFADGRPRLRFAPAKAPTASPTDAPMVTTASPSMTSVSGADGPPSGFGGWMLPLAGVAVVLAAAAAVYLRLGRGDRGGRGDDADGVLTDADRVHGLLEAGDGRMRQADIADELGWSSSKTSRVVSRMAEEGRVEKLRIGRENLIDLVGEKEE